MENSSDTHTQHSREFSKDLEDKHATKRRKVEIDLLRMLETGAPQETRCF